MVAWDVCPGEETIAAYVAGQLARPERDTLHVHFDTCSACQELVVALAKLATIDPPRGSMTEAPHDSLGVPSIPDEREGWTPGGQLGRYVLLARLGAGGMGVVYSAYDPELDRRVAVKVLRSTRAGDRLRDEARAIAKLAHPNVIAIHDVGEAEGEVFIAMEHVDGQTVRDWLRTPRTSAEILDVFLQAGRGLAAAHRAGLVHRDVKPSNIIVGADGRARVLDFGLAHDDARASEGTIAGTPAYMAPEQKRAEKVDARADQYAFAVTLSEALGIDTRGTIAPNDREAWETRRDAPARDARGVSERVTSALRRARSERADDRFLAMDDLLAELVPPPPRVRHWVFVSALVAIAAVGAIVLAVTRTKSVAACARAGSAIETVWSEPRHAELRAAFLATKLPFAKGVADSTIEHLDAWSARWRAQADATCRATMIEKTQPAATHALRQSCLDGLAQQLRPVVALVLAPDPEIVARAAALVSALPAPERCTDIAALSALPPLPPAESTRTEIDAIREEIARYEAALLAGRAEKIRADVVALQQRAGATGYAPLKARAQLLAGRLDVSAAHYAEGIAALHLAAQAATAARDLETLADVWIELSKALGNDVRSSDEAELFDGYAEALIGQLPDRDERTLELAFARCNRNITASQAAAQAEHCEKAIELGEKAEPPKRSLINAARVRLGHFQRMQGEPERALATLQLALDDAIALHGPQHPEVGIAHHVLGVALVDRENFDAGIAQLRAGLAIREVAFPGGNVQVAESLIGLGDALGASGNAAESVPAIERGLAILESLGQGASAHAANAHILVGMSLQELGRADEALAHFVTGADIADRSLQHREAIAAMGLRLAASIEIGRESYASAVPHLERAIRVLERGKAAPIELAKTQFALAQVLFELGPNERERAKGMLGAARASYMAAGAAGVAGLAEVEALARRD